MPLRQSEMGFSPLAVSYRKGERRVSDKVDRKKIGHVFGETGFVTIRKIKLITRNETRAKRNGGNNFYASYRKHYSKKKLGANRNGAFGPF